MGKIDNPFASKLPGIIDKFHEELGALERPRPYLGISQIGHPCERWLWLNFRWAVRETFPGRMLRLFRRGQDEERSIARDLTHAGITLEHIGSNQATVDFGCFISGHPDGIAVCGVPDAPKAKHIVEMKTHNDKSFQDVKKKGVAESKPMHYAQMQCYMLGLGIQRFLYVAINKNDDEYYIERGNLDEVFAKKLVAKGKKIALENHIPPPLSQDPTWYQCSWCAARDFCHGSHMIQPERITCRSCAHATPCKNSTWLCELHDKQLDYETQLAGCPSHVIHPDMVPWKLIPEKCTETSACYQIGERFEMNGEEGWESRCLLERHSSGHTNSEH